MRDARKNSLATMLAAMSGMFAGAFARDPNAIAIDELSVMAPLQSAEKRGRRRQRALLASADATERRLRVCGLWSPSMERPHSARQWHIRYPAPNVVHVWRPDYASPLQEKYPPGTVIELVNGWGQVVQRTWM